MTPEDKKIVRFIGMIIFGLIGLILFFGSFGIVGAGERGVKVRLGEVKGIVEPGVYFKLPIIEKVAKIDVKIRTVDYDKNGKEGDAKDTSELSGASKDLQDVKLGVVVTYNIDPNKVVDIYVQYKNSNAYEVSVVEPAIREIVKSTSAQYTAEELVTKRAEYSDKVNSIMRERFIDKGAILQTSSITNIEYSQAFTQAIEAKVTATQNAEAAKNKLEQIKFEAEQTVVKAKADAEAVQIKSQAVASQGGKDYVQLQAIEKWNGILPASMIPNATLPFINLK